MLYTVEDRNQLFELTNRHILSLVARIQRSNTIGLDQRLLRRVLYAGLNCPAFNDRQKYTLCVNSEDMSEIVKFPDFGKWFPFDTLVTFPGVDRRLLQYYAGLISKGAISEDEVRGIPNRFPPDNPDLCSPFGRVWFEWSADSAENTRFGEAVRREMGILHELVHTGWENNKEESEHRSINQNPSTTDMERAFGDMAVSPQITRSRARTESFSNVAVFASPAPRPTVGMASSNSSVNNNESPWGQRIQANPPNRAQDRVFGHRITQSSPNCLSSEDH
ncbi:hypothetical protein FE257_001246 [Aspergillus nanangensis]|uniref:Uncharacterized protein n=1 Tax=Aspergillus nanangensis TaxID=2582783 RepID=A0AAD4GPS7_ASPNN|nr:hypothetical protein FE257_001246 [Aspergillus nanangensis]